MTDKTSKQVADHHMRPDLVSSEPKRVLIVVANPTTATTVGWPVGFWGAELTHPYYELTERGIAEIRRHPAGNPTFLVIFGLGLGHHVRELVRRTEARWLTGLTIPANGGLITTAANILARAG